MSTAQNMSDVATDLLNQAKLSSSAQEKLFYLEQIKEVIFHRAPTLFPAFLDNITDFVVDKAVAVRKFLASFGGEALSKFPLHTPAIMNMFNILIRDEKDKVVWSVVLEMTRHYGRIAMHIIGLDTRSAKSFFTKSSKQQSPRELWDVLKSMSQHTVDLLSASRSAELRVQCIRFLSSWLLFSLPLDTFSQGLGHKRLKTEDASTHFQSTFNAGSISLHHAFLSKDQIEDEAKSLLNKLILWATRGGPQSAPFTEEQVGELGVVLAGVAAERPKESRAILPAVTFLVSSIGGSDGHKPLKLSPELKGIFLDSARDLVEGPSDDADEKKLRDALSSIQDTPDEKAAAPGGGGAAFLTNLLQINEEFSSEEDEPLEGDGQGGAAGDDVDDDENDLRIRNRAIAAINSFETSNGSSVGLPSDRTSNPPNTLGVAELHPVETRNTRDTVLADDAPVFPDPPAAGPLWTVFASSATDVAFRPSGSQVSAEGYFNMALSHLRSVLENGLQSSAHLQEKGRRIFIEMAIRLILTLSLGEMGGLDLERAINAQCVRTKLLSIFQNIRVTESEMLCDPPVPPQVTLPSVLVYVMGFCIRRVEESEYSTGGLSGRTAAAAEAAAVSSRIELLTAIACSIYERTRKNAAQALNNVEFVYDIDELDDSDDASDAHIGEEAEGGGGDDMELDGPAEEPLEEDDSLVSGADITLYENFCLAAFCRLFQRPQHRQKGAADFLFNLPYIPISILHVLKMLMYSGTLPDAAAENAVARRKRKRGSEAHQQQDLGTRMAAMEVLSQICLIEPVDASNQTTVVALSQLLWATTSSDFKTRTSAINIIVSELVPNGAFLNDMVTLFALQSALIISGPEAVNARCAGLRVFEKDNGERLAELPVSEQTEVEFVSVNIEDASLQFDGGASFYGSFDKSMKDLSVTGPSGDSADIKAAEDVDAVMRRHLHLLIQLCLLNPDTLESLFNLYGASAAVMEKESPDSRHALACRIIKSEFCNILASLASSFPPEKVLDRVLCSDPLARKLVILTLETLFSGAVHSASPEVVNKVRNYAGKHALYEHYVNQKGEVDTENSSVDQNLLLKLSSTELLVPVVSGLSASEVVEQVPFIVILCLRFRGDLEDALGEASGDAEGKGDPSTDAPMTALFHAFSRIVRPRPPPLSKAGLIAALHRLSAETDGVTDKEIQEAIGLCINKVNPQWDLGMKGPVVAEAALKLLSDESLPPPHQIMRTLLLACRIMPEVMKFMLSEAIPRLARRRAWESAPRVWDGVLHAMKKYYSASARDGVESLLRTILGLPLKQFNIVLQLCGGNIKDVLNTAVKTFSIAEKGEVLSGNWIGLAEFNSDGADADKKLELIGLSPA